MQLPAVQYGDWKTVKKRMARAVTQLKRGADFVDVMTVDGMLDTELTAGRLIIMGIEGGPVPHFHCFMPWKTLWDALFDRDNPGGPIARENAIFEASLRTSWGILGLVATDSQAWLIPAERHRPLLHAALEVWPELDAVGARYYGAVQGRRLWDMPNNLKYVMANLGVPTELLTAALPPGGPGALLRYVRPAA